MLGYGYAILTGAFLLFQVQPLMGKYLLPWFGGAPAVWTTCLVFFQVALLGGYAYAHLSRRLLRPRGQALVHLVLLAAALAMLPITPNASWKPHTAADPTLHIIALLAVTLGLPYFALSATAPLLQHWFSLSHPRRSPYRLYALSNAGSLLALLSYPLYFETHFTRQAQAVIWGWGLAAYTFGCALCAVRLCKSQAHGPRPPSNAQPSTFDRRPSTLNRLLWLLLPACASTLLLAITNKICQDIAPVAFLWVLPLALYLLSFIICFDRPRWYHRLGFGLALLAAMLTMEGTLTGRLALSAPLQVVVYTAGLFVCCMVCHGEVYRLRPDPKYLTTFYLMLAAGGACGGVFVAVVAPLLFTNYFELHVGLVLTGLLFLITCGVERKAESLRRWPSVIWAASGLAVAGLALDLWQHASRGGGVQAYRSRNFYGVLTVNRYELADPAHSQVELMHGRIAHGMQFLHPSRAGWPTLYYSPGSGIGRVFGWLAPGHRRVGVVGLGTGTVAAYAQRGDQFRFYEINPEVERVATNYFTYLRNSPADVKVILGDARLSLDSEPPQNFDLLVLDAFNSDSIPIHLLTREAFAVYLRHLKTNGIIAVHISNASLNLEPVLTNLACHVEAEAVILAQPQADYASGVLPSVWAVLTRNLEFMRADPIRLAARPAVASSSQAPLWTDDFSGLFPVVRWGDLFGGSAQEMKVCVQPAATLVKSGDVAGAIAALGEAVNREPNSAPALNNLACLLATAPDAALRDGTRAVQLAERACRITEYRDTVMVSTLAAAYAEVGRFDEAVATAEKACALATENGQPELLRRNRQLLEFYRRKQPYHQGPP